MDFEWDPVKAKRNARKHGVTFTEAASVFGDPLAVTFADPDCSQREPRELTFGRSDLDRLLVVAHTERQGRTRIVSARRLSRPERSIYENG